jgi:hypothetical protein
MLCLLHPYCAAWRLQTLRFFSGPRRRLSNLRAPILISHPIRLRRNSLKEVRHRMYKARRRPVIPKPLRTHLLKIHQRLGLITAIPMIATVATSFGAGGRATSTSDRWAHMALGAATSDLYFTAAYFAIRAPDIPGMQRRGPIRVHRALAWIHGPGMILTPILGAIAFDQKSKGEKVHGIASAHGPVAIVTAGAFGAALLSVSLKF